MPVLSVHRLTKYFGERCLFADVTFDVDAKERVGFVGDNGCGKTTLFQMLIGKEPADDGEIVTRAGLRIGYMEQHVCRDSDRTLFDEVLTVFAPLTEAEAALAALDAALAAAPTEALIERHTALRERFERDGGLYFRGRVTAALKGLGFSDDEIARSVRTLSGGQRAKAALAKLLLSDSDLLLLDEPTNHLDIPSVEWLEEYLRGFGGAMIVVSHDRWFLDRVTGRTIELAHGRLYQTAGSYSLHRERRAAERAVEAHHYESALRAIEKTRQSIETLRSFNREKSVKRARSKEKTLDRQMEALERPEAEGKTVHFTFAPRTVSGNDVLMADGVGMRFGDAPLFSGVDLHIRRRDRVFLLGPNGCGKTTLLKIFSHRLAPTAGLVRRGEKVSIGYYDQTQESLPDDKTALDAVWDWYPERTETEIRRALAAFLFRGDAVFRRVGQMSGGERARLLLLRLMLAGDNFLLLDEPTNHLDIGSREALEEALDGYDGTLMVVSHDRYFINRLANRILLLRRDGVSETDGNYDDYIRAAVSPKPKKPPAENGYKQTKAADAARRRQAALLRQAEARVAALEAEQATLRERLNDPAAAADYQELSAVTAALAALDEQILAAMAEWETLTLSSE